MKKGNEAGEGNKINCILKILTSALNFWLKI